MESQIIIIIKPMTLINFINLEFNFDFNMTVFWFFIFIIFIFLLTYYFFERACLLFLYYLDCYCYFQIPHFIRKAKNYFIVDAKPKNLHQYNRILFI